MTEFMFIYKGGDPAWKKNVSPQEMQATMAKWGEWIGGLQASGNLSTGGAPLEGFGKNVSADGVVTDMSLAEVKELVGGYSIVKAENIEKALEFAKTCPVFSDGGSYVEVRPVLKMD